MRLRKLSVALSSWLLLTMTMVAAGTAATPAMAATKAKTSADSTAAAGGATPGSTTESTSSTGAGQIDTSASGGAAPTSPAAPATPAHHAPITAKTPNIAYHGPVYEKTATGQIVPYTTPASTTTTAGTSGTGASASVSSAGADSLSASPGTTGTTGTTTATTGGSSPVNSPSGGGLTTGPADGPVARPELLVPGHTAHIIDGFAAAPMDAPAAVQQIIWSGNELIGLPYIYGGGHGSFISPGYDCSGTVSFALHGASLLSTPMDSTEFEGWGGKGVGTWVTIFANGGHAYMTVAGIRLDTSPANDPSGLEGPRWRPLRPENAGFVVRHPTGL